MINLGASVGCEAGVKISLWGSLMRRWWAEEVMPQTGVAASWRTVSCVLEALWRRSATGVCTPIPSALSGGDASRGGAFGPLSPAKDNECLSFVVGLTQELAQRAALGVRRGVGRLLDSRQVSPRPRSRSGRRDLWSSAVRRPGICPASSRRRQLTGRVMTDDG
jgi:hypothetical protein